MATELEIVRNEDGIATVRQVWQQEITRPDREQVVREREIQQYVRDLAKMYERKAAEVAALRDHARKLGEHTEALQQQVEEQEREQARLREANCELERTFRVLADEWLNETGYLSDPVEKFLHPAYLQIIGLGKVALPLILREVQRRTGHWFVALESIARLTPVRPEDAHSIERTTTAWLEWGASEGLI